MIDKVKIARSFSRSAETYDQAAYFQREVGSTLLDFFHCSVEKDEKIKKNDNKAERYCIDIGCGTGFFKNKIEALFPAIQYVGLDLAEGMLSYVSNKDFGDEKSSNKYSAEKPFLICADAEKLPIADNAVDYLFSNMALQWCDNLPLLFSEANRVLSSKGVFTFTTLGPKTLYELKQAWSHVDSLTHVNEFAALAEWKKVILDSSFTIELEKQKETILEYGSVITLLKELKLLGAQNVNDGQRQSLTAPKRLQKLLASYYKCDEGLTYPATYDVYYWVLRKG
ncbi:MAG: malonyl-CoA O-methyltransferase [Cellvibrionaceae bacterium]|jgi:malonyl-CoA O-methyltransferase